MTASEPSRVLTLELPDEALLMSVAEEGALQDKDLDHLEGELETGSLEPERGAAIALMLGRAGRAQSARVLTAYARVLRELGAPTLSAAVDLAIDLLCLPPPCRVERADLGYRHTHPRTGQQLYVEDALAAYWHRRQRWGPPLRPRVEDRDVLAHGDGAKVDDWLRVAREGGLVRIDFRPGPLGGRLWALPGFGQLLRREDVATGAARLGFRNHWVGRERCLWLTRAGFAYDRSFQSPYRWSQLRSLGLMRGPFRRRVAFQIGKGSPKTMPAGGSIPVDVLHDMMVALGPSSRT